jgi:uncharacterized membrane protein YeiH
MLHLLDYIGIIAFALTGAMVASQQKMDLFGGLVLALATAVGGGTLRDLLLNTPVFWVVKPIYISLSVAGFGLAWGFMAIWRTWPTRLIDVADALGLAVFSILGTQKALHLGAPPTVALIMGALTGIGGGLLRDVLARVKPMVLQRQQIYGTPAVLGIALFLATHQLAASMAVVFALRMAGICLNWRLPFFPQIFRKKTKKDSSKT